jgi:predicted DCC family thiol-disulfide oxidoreductase YuxK
MTGQSQELSSLTVFYDSNCGFCCSCRDWLTGQPQYLQLEFISFQSQRARALCPDLGDELFKQDLVVRDNLGGFYTGADAFVMVLYACQEYRQWSLTLSSSALKPLARLFFKKLSKNRRGLSRLTQYFRPVRDDELDPMDCRSGRCAADDDSPLRELRCAQMCSYCRDCLDDTNTLICDQCQTTMHPACYTELGACPSLGCEGQLTNYWRQEASSKSPSIPVISMLFLVSMLLSQSPLFDVGGSLTRAPWCYESLTYVTPLFLVPMLIAATYRGFVPGISAG